MNDGQNESGHDPVVAMESTRERCEKLAEDKNNIGDDENVRDLTAVQSVVARDLRDVGDELCRSQALHHRSRHQHRPQQQRYVEMTILRNVLTLVCT